MGNAFLGAWNVVGSKPIQPKWISLPIHKERRADELPMAPWLAECAPAVLPDDFTAGNTYEASVKIDVQDVTRIGELNDAYPVETKIRLKVVAPGSGGGSPMDATETVKLETIARAAAHRRAAEEHGAEIERVREQLRQRDEEHAALERQFAEQRAAQQAKAEETQREYEARLEPIRAENRQMEERVRANG